MLGLDGATLTRTLTVTNDPREGNATAQLAALHALQMRILAALGTGHSLEGLIAQARQAGTADTSVLDRMAGQGGRGRGGFGRGGGAATAPTLASTQAELLGLLSLLESPADAAPTGPQHDSYLRACQDLNQLVAAWNALPGSHAPGPPLANCALP